MWSSTGVDPAVDDTERTVPIELHAAWAPDECTEEFLAPLLDEASLVPPDEGLPLPSAASRRSHGAWVFLGATALAAGLGFTAGALTVLVGALTAALLLL